MNEGEGKYVPADDPNKAKPFSRRLFLEGSLVVAIGGLVGCNNSRDGQSWQPKITTESTPLNVETPPSDSPSASPLASETISKKPTSSESQASMSPETTRKPEVKIQKSMPTKIWFTNKELGGARDFVPVGLNDEGGIGDPEGRENKDKFGIYVAPQWGPLPGEGRRVITTGHTYEDGSGAYPPDAKDKILVGARFFVKTESGQIVEYEVTKKTVIDEDDYSRYVEENDLYGYGPGSKQEEMVGITCTNYDPRVRNHTARLIFIAKAVGVINPT